MTQRIEREITRNRRQVQRIESYYRQPAPTQSTTVGGSALPLALDVSATLSTRPLTDSLIAGHPDASNQPGQGIVGDRRGSWTEQTTTSTGVVVTDGRRALMGSLAGAQLGVTSAEVGDGTTAPSQADSDLEAGRGQAGAWYQSGSLSTELSTTWESDARFDQVPNTVSELGLWVSDGSLLCRLAVNDLSVPTDAELKVTVTVSVSPVSTPGIALTDGTVISNALASDATSPRLAEIALGTDGTAPSQSDTTLGNEVVRKPAGGEPAAASVRAWALVPRDEPSTQPHEIRELGLLDDSGRLVSRATFGAATKDDRTRMRPTQTVRL